MSDHRTDGGGTRGRPEGARIPRFIWVLLAFVVLSLLALVVVPVYHDRQIASIERELAEVLEPARSLAGRLELVQAEEMAALQAFVLSGDGRFRQRYRQARDEEQAVYDSLYVLAHDMDLSVRERMVNLWSVSARWHVEHIPLVTERASRAEYRSLLTDEQELYDELVGAAGSLKETIADETAAVRRRMEEARTRNIRITAGLVALALGATLAVGFLGWKLATLHRVAEQRRGEAVDARREIDAVLAATGDGVMGVDLEGRCTFLNRAGAELLGTASRRVLGRPVHDLIHHSRPDGSPYPPGECPVLRSLESGEEIQRTDELLWRPDGSSFPARLSARPMVDGREVKGVVLTFTDLTEIRETEEALRRAVRARDEVVAVVSHDLRNPLATISSAAELLLDVDVPEERRREHLRGIGAAADRMGRLIRDLLDVARIEAGGLSVEPRPVPARRLLDDAVEMARPLLRDRGILLERSGEEDLPAVRADRDRVLQVFQNLVGNAAKFTPEEGRVTLSARRRGDRVVFGVDDTGPGIPPEDQERLFDRFWRIDRSDRDGTGLGLAIVKGIVEAHGGRVWVESEPGSGSRFRFTLAADPSDRVARERDPAAREADPAAPEEAR